MFAALILLLLAPSVGPLNDLMEVYATPVRLRGFRMTCDMRSDTCSDGRRITTVRATPVPCETSPGVWEMVPEDTGCYSVRGLESWAQNTSYLSWGAEFDRSPWVVMSGSQLSALPEGGYRLCQTGTDPNTGLNQTYSAGLQEEEWATVAVIARPNTASAMMLGVALGQYNNNLMMTGQDWRIYSYSARYDSTTQRVHIYPRPGGQQLCIDLLGAWLAKSNTPGRACWGGEAPVTCARDFHRMSAAGFPTTMGEISWVMSLERMPDGGSGLRGIVWADGAPIPNRISLMGDGGIRVYTGETAYTTGPLSWEPGRSYTFRLIMAEDGWKVVRDGELVGSTPPLGSMDWRDTVRLGDLLDGAISSLRVRSFE